MSPAAPPVNPLHPLHPLRQAYLAAPHDLNAAWQYVTLGLQLRAWDGLSIQALHALMASGSPYALEAKLYYSYHLSELHEVEAVRALHAELAAAQPHNTLFRWERSQSALYGGDFASAWADYDVRYRFYGERAKQQGWYVQSDAQSDAQCDPQTTSQTFTHNLPHPSTVLEDNPHHSHDAADDAVWYGRRAIDALHFPLPLWRGEPLKGKRLLVHGERGLGDNLMNASLLNELAQSAKQVYYGVPAAQVELMAHSFPKLQVFALQHAMQDAQTWLHGYAALAKAHDLQPDYHINGGSAMRFLRPNLQSFERAGCGYIHTPPRVRGAFAESIAQAAAANSAISGATNGATYGKRLKVGLAWGIQGDKGASDAVNRGIPNEALAPLLANPQLFLMSLHNADMAQHHTQLPQISRAETALQSFSETAALMDEMDVVVTKDTSIAHLAGAMGKACITVLSNKPDWRWLRFAERCHLYPNTLLLRQGESGNWLDVMHRVAAKLQEMRLSQ